MSSVRRVIVQAVWTPARICEQLRIPFHLSNTLLKKATGTKVACWGGGGGGVVVVVLARVTSHPHRTHWYKHTHDLGPTRSHGDGVGGNFTIHKPCWQSVKPSMTIIRCPLSHSARRAASPYVGWYTLPPPVYDPHGLRSGNWAAGVCVCVCVCGRDVWWCAAML